MRSGNFSRRDVMKAAAAAAATSPFFATPLRAAPPPSEAITPALIEAARL
ncbi:MAG: twin-arginine translocation signal domain-containing protein, partial [Proteobacteria bacterium]|nr:twin-arginine translocation signal domain-containing protein [Pseudomonadota bacterium]